MLGFALLLSSLRVEAKTFPPRERVETLTAAATVSGVVLPAGTRIELQGPPVDPAAVVAAGDWWLKAIVPARDLTLWGIPFAANERIENTQPAGRAFEWGRGTLARDFSAHDVMLKQGTLVWFSRGSGANDSGISIYVGTLAAPGRAGELGFPSGTTVGWSPHRPHLRVEFIRLQETTMLNGMNLWGPVAFHRNGGIRGAFLAADSVLHGIRCRSERPPLEAKDVVERYGVTFHDDGGVESCTLAGPQKVYGIPVEGELVLRDDGAISSCTLAEPFRIDNAEWPRGTQLELGKSARLHRK